MDPAFWHRRWQNNQIGFHQPAGHRWLTQYWPSLGIDAGQAVLVPLCGKTPDLRQLHDMGHPVTGAELSRAALDAFGQEQQITLRWDKQASFDVAIAPGYTLYCGDFFALRPDQTADARAVYDRAALIALPPAMRSRYVEHLRHILSPGWRLLLITLEYDQAEMAGPPFSVMPEEVRHLFQGCALRELAHEDVLSRQQSFVDAGLSGIAERAWLISDNQKQKKGAASAP